MAYSSADVIDTMVGSSGRRFKRLRVDGGASANDWLMQFQADVLGVPVERPANVETTALGAAGLAGIASDVWSSAEEFLGAQKFTTFEPNAPGTKKELRAGWTRAVNTALHWASANGK
jgi:glycerol kinase